MTKKKLNGVHIWKQFEDLLVPRLHLSVVDRAVYSHLLRHSRLEGRLQIRFSILRLGRGAGLSAWATRKAVRRLVAKGALRLAERSRAGHVVEVRLPEEIRSVRAGKIEGGGAGREDAGLKPGATFRDLEKADFLKTRALREAIYAREGGFCFYCLRRLSPMVRCLDHVVPRVRRGRNSYRNLVSSCVECNSKKGERRAEDFLRWLYREGRLTAGELTGRLRALGGLATGKLRPLRLPRQAPAAQPGFHRLAQTVPGDRERKQP